MKSSLERKYCKIISNENRRIEKSLKKENLKRKSVLKIDYS